MEKHINVVAALQIGLSILTVIVGVVLFFVLDFAGGYAENAESQFIISTVGNAAIIFFIVISIPGIIAGIGLLKRKEWARILTLIISVLLLFNFPIGTAVGVYSIWALVQHENVEEFKKS
ncbi:MAG: hypothetical protein ACOC1J_00885 [Prolixibacteraceae bacterium]